MLDAIFGRALLLVVGSSARTLIVDASGLTHPGSVPVVEAAERFFAQRRMQGKVQVALVGLSATGEGPAAGWVKVAARHGVELVSFERFDAALALALERAGRPLRG